MIARPSTRINAVLFAVRAAGCGSGPKLVMHDTRAFEEKAMTLPVSPDEAKVLAANFLRDERGTLGDEPVGVGFLSMIAGDQYVFQFPAKIDSSYRQRWTHGLFVDGQTGRAWRRRPASSAATR